MVGSWRYKKNCDTLKKRMEEGLLLFGLKVTSKMFEHVQRFGLTCRYGFPVADYSKLPPCCHCCGGIGGVALAVCMFNIVVFPFTLY